MTDKDERQQPSDWDEIRALVKRENAERAERYQTMRQMATASAKAMTGWGEVKTEDDWLQVTNDAYESFRSGKFLLERMGAERHLDPELAAVIWNLREGIIGEFAPVALHEMLLIDMAVLGYYHALRVNGWIGNFAMLIEAEFFGQAGPTMKYRFSGRQGWQQDSMKAEDYLQRVGEDLMPLVDRANRQMIRNLKAIHEMRRGAPAMVSIRDVGQVNVGERQVNVSQQQRSS